MKIILIILTIALIILSCGNEEKKVVKNQLVDTLFYESFYTEEMLYLPTSSLINKNKLYIYDQIDSPIIKVYDFPKIKYSTSFGRTGRGPEDLMLTTSNEFFHIENKLYIPSNNSVKIFEEEEYIDTWLLPSKDTPLNKLTPINNRYYASENISSDVYQEFEFFMIDSKTGSISNYFSIIPNYEEDLDFKTRRILSSKLTTSSPKRGLMAIFYIFHNNWKIYDVSGNEIFNSIEGEIKNNFHPYDPSENLVYFMDCYSNSDEIYTISLFKTEKDIESFFYPSLKIFDWSGELKNEFILDTCITHISVDEEGEYLVGTHVNNSNTIYRWQLQ